jgi:hypothetical protein
VRASHAIYRGQGRTEDNTDNLWSLATHAYAETKKLKKFKLKIWTKNMWTRGSDASRNATVTPITPETEIYSKKFQNNSEICSEISKISEIYSKLSNLRPLTPNCTALDRRILKKKKR